FQAEDGIRDRNVTGVQTCALPILVGALMVDLDDEVYAITSSGGVIRTLAKQVRKAGRQTKGVRLMNLAEGDTLLAIARNADEPEDVEQDATGNDAPEES